MPDGIRISSPCLPLRRSWPFLEGGHHVRRSVGVSTHKHIRILGPETGAMAASGVKNWKIAPCGSFASTHNRPPCASMIERQIDRPMPKPLGLGRVEGLEQPLDGSQEPAPDLIPHRDEHAIRFGLAVVMNNSRGPSATAPIAWTALTMRLRTTCCNCTRSPSMSGKPSKSAVCTDVPFFRFAAGELNHLADHLVHVHQSFRGGAFLMSSRIRPMTSPARLAFLTIRPSVCRTSSRSGGPHLTSAAPPGRW